MAAAIKASLADTLKEDEDSGSDLETFSDEDSREAAEPRATKNGGQGVKNGGAVAKNGGVGVKNGGVGVKNGGSVGRSMPVVEEVEGWRAHLGEGGDTTTILIRWGHLTSHPT